MKTSKRYEVDSSDWSEFCEHFAHDIAHDNMSGYKSLYDRLVSKRLLIEETWEYPFFAQLFFKCVIIIGTPHPSNPKLIVVAYSHYGVKFLSILLDEMTFVPKLQNMEQHFRFLAQRGLEEISPTSPPEHASGAHSKVKTHRFLKW